MVVQGTGHKLFAGAALADDQDGGIGMGHRLDELLEAQDRFALPDQRVKAHGEVDLLGES
jgi:hypothetical protein